MAEFALVGKALEYGEGTGGAEDALVPNQLIAGAIGIYAFDPSDNAYKLVVNGGASTGQVNAAGLSSKDVTFFLGTGNGDVYQSESHQIKGIRQWKKDAYVAPVQEVIDIGSNGTDGNLDVPSLIAEGSTDALIRLSEQTPGNHDYGNWFYFDGGRITSSDTDDTVADKLVAAINNNPKNTGLFVATKNSQAANRGVRITVQEAGRSFTTVIGGVIENAQVRVSTPFNTGSGTPSQIAEKELLDNIYRGDFYTADGGAYRIFRGLKQVASGATYVTYWIRSVNESADKTGQKATVDHEVKTWIAVPTGSAIITDLDAILAALVASSGGTGPQGPQGDEGPQGPQGDPG